MQTTQTAISPKSYSDLELLYIEMNNNYKDLCQKLFEFTNNYKYSNSSEIMSKQESSEKDLSACDLGSRFYRNFFDNKTFLSEMKACQVDDLLHKKDLTYLPQLPEALRMPSITFPNSNEYNSLPDNEKLKLERTILQNSAIVSARLANVYNRTAHSSKSSYLQTKAAFSRKDIAMQEFLINAIKHNELSKHLGLENDQIAFGFSKDSKGIALTSSLPGFSMLSVHFGSVKNFRDMCNFVNNRVPVSFNWYQIENTGQFQYNLPTFGVINTGIINRDNYNSSHDIAQQLRTKARNEDGSIIPNGIEEFLNFMYPDFNDREIFQLAELAGLGQGFLQYISDMLPQRAEMTEQAEEQGKSLSDVYVLQRLSQTQSPEEVKSLFRSLWESKKIELFNDVYEEDMEDFKDYLSDLVAEHNVGIPNIQSQINDFYSQLMEIAESVEPSELEEVEKIEASYLSRQDAQH